MLYLALYLQRRMNWSGSRLLRPTLQIAAIMLSWYTGLTRVSDYKHHWYYSLCEIQSRSYVRYRCLYYRNAGVTSYRDSLLAPSQPV